MPSIRKSILILASTLAILSFSSCSVWRSMFGPKYGCPANGKAVGAERILSGEKVPKAKKFRS